MQKHNINDLTLDNELAKETGNSNTTLSSFCFLDKVVFRSSSRSSTRQLNQTFVPLYNYIKTEEPYEKFLDQLKEYNVDHAKKGLNISGINYYISQVKNTKFYWVGIAKKENPTRSDKPKLIKSKLYGPELEGKPFIEDADNFIQDCAIIGNINFVPGKQLRDVKELYDTIVNATECAGIKKYRVFIHQLEINIAINAFKNDEAIYDQILLIARYLFGKPFQIGVRHNDFKISRHIRLKFYRKIPLSSDGKIPGMIRCELVLRNIKVKNAVDIDKVVVKAQNELVRIVTYIYNCLSKAPIENDQVNDLKLSPALYSGPVKKLMIPENLIECFTKIQFPNLNRFVLNPELLAYFINKE